MKEEKIIVNNVEKVKITLDEIDEDIIKMLQKDAKTSNREIKDDLGISIGTIHNRISKMEEHNESKVIRLN